MKYAISKSTCNDFIKISKKEFVNGNKAKNNLSEVLYIEEKFNIILENYVEYEKQLLDDTLNHAFFHNMEWSTIVNEIHTINRRIINLLSSCRMYLDQIPQNLTSIYEKEAKIKSKLKEKKSEEYDSNFGYRFLEELRNYTQHCDLPINKLEYNSDKYDDEEIIKFMTTPIIYVNRIEEDDNFKKAVLSELKDKGNEVDITPFIRQYISSIGEIHEYLRNLLEKDIEKWDSIFEKIIEKYKEKYGDNIVGLEIVELDKNKEVKNISIFKDIIKRRKKLARKNNYLRNFDNYVITNEIN